jgi:hypothetical protein
MTEQEYTAVETNCETGETTYRPMTDVEIADLQKFTQEEAERTAAAEEEAAAKAEAKAAALAKLTALGLTEEEAKAIAG